MFFNYDSLFVVGSVIVGGLITYSFYNCIFTNNSDSLVNTLPNLDTIQELTETAYPILQPNVLHKIDVGVQTEATVQVADASVQATTIHVNTGIQTSARIWYETVKNWISELLSMRSSEIQCVTPTEVRVESWLDNLNATQLVSTNSMNSVVSQGLVNVNDSTSNVVESIVPQLIDPTQIPLPVSDVSSVVTNAVVDYSQYTFLGEVVLHAATNQALIQSMSNGMGYC